MESLESILARFELVETEKIAPEKSSSNEQASFQLYQYQTAMYHICIQRNTILCSSTGSGKTYVACKVVQHYVTVTPDETFCVFLVNTVALAIQQYNVFKRLMEDPKEVALFHGSMNVDLWDLDKWLNELEGKRVLVLTGQVFLDMLMHAYMSIEQVSLLILDECHHARENHPYALLLRTFYRKSETKTRIIGLTASPVYEFNEQGIVGAIDLLEKLMDAEAVVPVDEIRGGRAQLETIDYQSSTEITNFLFLKHLEEYCDIRWFIEDCSVLFDEIGLCGAEMYIKKITSYHEKSTLSNFKLILEVIEKSKSMNVPFYSEKFVKLKSLLSKDKTTIVFVHRRIVCYVLSLVLSCDFECGCIVGQAIRSNKIQDKIFDENSSLRFLEKLRSGHVKLMIATQVIEEGIDIPKCDLVIRYNFPLTVVSFLQSKGRARKVESQFIVFVKDEKEREQLISYGKYEETVRAILPDNEEIDLNNIDIDDGYGPVFIVESTGARVTMHSSISLLSRYCATLKCDDYTRNRPILTETIEDVTPNLPFQCRLELPRNCSSVEHEIFGDPQLSKKLARASVCYKACIHLFNSGCLNEYLLPDIQAEKKKLQNKTKMMLRSLNTFVSFPPLISCADVFYLHELENSCVFLLLAAPIPQSPHFIEEMQCNLLLKGICTLNEEQLESAMHYTKICLELLDRSEKEFKLHHPRFYLLKGGQENITEQSNDQEKKNVNDIAVIDWKSMKGSSAPIDSLDQLAPGESILASFSSKRRYFVFQREVKKISPLDVRKIMSVYSLKEVEIECSWVYVERIQGLFPNSHYKRDSHISPIYIHELYPITASELDHISKIPYALQSATSAFSLSKLQMDLPPDLLQQAMTSSWHNRDCNYERLEFLGDAVLKMVVSTSLFVIHPTKNEGYLAGVKDELVNNKRLACIAIKKRLNDVIHHSPFQESLWKVNNVEGSVISEKVLADVVEALIGAYFLTHGLEATYGFISDYFEIIDQSVKLTDIGTVYKNSDEIHLADHRIENLCSVAKIFLPDHQVVNHFLFEEALTHASSVNGKVCYQRLEFIGDAILDVIVTVFIYKNFKKASPRDLHSMRIALVNSVVLGRLSHHFRFPQTMNYFNADIRNHLIDYSWECVGDPLDIYVKPHPQKFASDLYESLLAASFIECGYDIERLEKVLFSTHYPAIGIDSLDFPFVPNLGTLRFMLRNHCKDFLVDAIVKIKCVDSTEAMTGILNSREITILGALMELSEKKPTNYWEEKNLELMISLRWGIYACDLIPAGKTVCCWISHGDVVLVKWADKEWDATLDFAIHVMKRMRNGSFVCSCLKKRPSPVSFDEKATKK